MYKLKQGEISVKVKKTLRIMELRLVLKPIF